MNAKELIEAAKRVRDSAQHEWDAFAVSDIARHILATVRPDDDEPVTRERLEADGWFCRECVWINMDSQSLAVTIADGRAWVSIGSEKVKMGGPLNNMGHLRRLVAALGE